MAAFQCPLDLLLLHHFKTRMDVARVKEIEEHVSSAICLHPPLKDLVLRGTFKGSTPLLLACGEGHLDSVTHIIEVWGVNVRAAGTYYHHQRKIGGATPIFVAALRGHVDIVRYLIIKEAEVSATTSTIANYLGHNGLTPLYGALIRIRSRNLSSEKYIESNDIIRLLLEADANAFTLSSEGIRPVWESHFCSVDATIILVNNGLNLSQRNSLGETMLHYWIYASSSFNNRITEEERLIVVRLLLDKMTDLMTRDNRGFTPILRSANSNKLVILNLMLERDDIDRIEKIDAMELAGAHLIIERTDLEAAFDYWRRALDLRLESGSDSIHKIPLQRRSERAAVEWVTRAQLEYVIQHSSETWIQSVLILLRIYSGKSLKALNNVITDVLYRYKFEERKMADRIDVLWAILEVVLRFHPQERLLSGLTEEVVDNLTKLLGTLGKRDPLLNIETIMTSFQLISAVDPDCCFTLPSYNFFTMLAHLPGVLLHEHIRKYLSQLVRQDDGSLLLRACFNRDLATIRFLLQAGADPNASESNGDRPLHIVANWEKDSNTEFTFAHLLFDYGAQPCRINNQGKTAVDIWIERNCGGEGMQSIAWNGRPNWCRGTVPKLSCLSAKLINTHGISHDVLPTTLHSFLKMH